MKSRRGNGAFSLTSRSVALVGTVLLCMMMQSALAAETAATLYKQCRDKPSTAEQRDCYPAAVRQSEIELASAEKSARRYGGTGKDQSGEPCNASRTRF